MLMLPLSHLTSGSKGIFPEGKPGTDNAQHHIMQDEDLQKVHELFAAVGKTNPPHPDISATQWLRDQVRKTFHREELRLSYVMV